MNQGVVHTPKFLALMISGMPFDLVLLVSLALLAAGVVASVLPVVPSGLLSLSGVYLFWWSTGFTVPSTSFVVVVTVLGLLAVAADYFGTPIAANAAGTTVRVAVVAGIVGLLLFPITGPAGVLIGAGGVVYLAQRRRGRPRRESVETAIQTVVGMVLANVVEIVLTVTIFLAFVVVVLL